MLPLVYVNFFEEQLGARAAKILAAAWYKHSQISLNSSSREELLFEARMILAIANK